MARYFQNIDPNDENFQKVTELEMIDNSDDSMLMFYFKNGAKCSKDFIAEVSDKEAFGKKAYIELTSPRNCWAFKEIKLTEQVKYGTNANGERVECVDPYMSAHADKVGSIKWQCVKVPNVVNNFTPESDNNYYIIKNDADLEQVVNHKAEPKKKESKKEEPKEETQEFDFNVNIEETPFANKENNVKTESLKQAEEAVINNVFKIDSSDLISFGKTVIFDFEGKHYEIDAKQFFKNAVSKPEEKIVEKVVEKVVEKEVMINKPTDHLQIDIDENQKQLIDNMIDMSQKDKCDIDMEITLSLPPVDVYRLIKNVYPDGMAKSFVNIIADRMQILELKSAVANGLLAYYDESVEIAVEHSDKNNK